MSQKMHATTILAVKKDKKIAIIGDGQVTLGSNVVKGNAAKVRKISNDIIVGFAGATADAFTLLDRMEEKLELRGGNLMRAALDLVKDWRTDRYLRRLEAMMIVADKEHLLLLSGAGDIIQPENNIIAIGSGGDFARSSALALYENTDLSALDICKKSMEIAASICIYTNNNFTFFEIDAVE